MEGFKRRVFILNSKLVIYVQTTAGEISKKYSIVRILQQAHVYSSYVEIV